MNRKLILEQRKRVEEFIHNISNEQNGFKFGNPWRHDEKSITCILPILRDLKEKRLYLTLAEAKNVKLEDTGSISKARVTNNEDLPIFIRMGDLLTGSTQERTVTSSVIIMPGETKEVNIVCVHASKGINMGATYTWDGYAPGKDWLFLNQIYTTGEVNQQASWISDRTYYTKACSYVSNSIEYGNSASPSSYQPSTGVLQPYVYTDYITPFSSQDNLTKTRDDINKIFDNIIKEVPLFENQIGIALIDTKGFHSLECYDLYDSYKVIKDALMGKESTTIIDKTEEENVFNYNPEYAKNTVNKVLNQEFKEKVVFENDRAKTIIIEIEKYLGEAVLLDNKVIHLTLTRKET